MGIEAEKSVGALSNSETVVAVDSGSRASGVSLVSERECAQPAVKVPKYRLSAIRREFVVSDSWEVGLEAAIL